jgi:cellulose synthase/poly-beta-1,6-N-acetylglucosamine synthase-like glycosyltransferase
VVLDADNVMNDYFLHEINKTYNKGALAIQGQRIAKNEENNLAQLDAISEGINNNIFRKGHQNLGLSSALIGSGMAFDFQLFKNHMSAIKALGGFDKELELSLLKNKVRIAYVPEAEVYDEKVSDKKSFSNQRTRWIAAQIRFGIRSFRSGVARLITEGNIDYFDKVLQFLLLPRLILLGVLVISAVGAFFIHSTAFYILAACLFTAISALIIATPAQYQSIRFLQLIASLPGIFFSMIVAIGGYKKAANNFLHTAHKSKTIS